jgi:hypothetical protein
MLCRPSMVCRDLSSAGIQTIHPRAFAGLPALRQLYVKTFEMCRCLNGRLDTCHTSCPRDLGYNTLARVPTESVSPLRELAFLYGHDPNSVQPRP